MPPRPADDPEEDLYLGADDSQETGEEEADDLLSGLSDEQKAEIERRAQARADEQINQFKGSYGRRFGAAIADARNKGLDIGEDGTVLIRDPQAAAKALGITVAQAEQRMTEQQATDPLDEPIDAYNDDPATVQQKIQRQIQKGIESALTPLKSELEQVRGTAYRPVLDAIPNIGREHLETYGLGHIADHPEFDETLQGTLQALAAQNPKALTDPKAIAAAAMFIVPMLEETLPDDVRRRAADTRKGQDPAALAAEARRAALGRNGVSRHTPARSGAFTDEEIAGAEELKEMFPGSAERMTPAMVGALGKMDTDPGGVSLDDWRAAKRKNGARR
jgi:hypothetical protein